MNWVDLINSLISIWKEHQIATIIIFFLLIIYFGYKKLKNKSEKEINKLRRENKKQKTEIKILENNTCQDCKKIYFYTYPSDNWISFSEDPKSEWEKFSLIEEMSDEYEERMVYHLNNEWIFISFWKKEDGEYLISLKENEIYLPIGKGQESNYDCLLYYRIFCPKRKKHLKFDTLI